MDATLPGMEMPVRPLPANARLPTAVTLPGMTAPFRPLHPSKA